ncbi:thioredoxin family protein [Flavobacteriaceae bacterium KMM 6897]|nr:thioredoxin family protein [Flavobacteriaceae bacterium KMM 6897]MEB8345592.1 thioredoxin family protein [Flavobacteriaceae bacterium KMM 6898]
MKCFIILFMLPFFIGAQENTSLFDQGEWRTDYENALETAKRDKQNIMIYFTGSDWCPPCKMLKKDFFETSEFKILSKSYVLLYIDIPRSSTSISMEQMAHNKQLLPKLNKKGVFPLIKIINSRGEELDELSGYRMNGDIQPYVALMNKYK